MEKKTKLSTVVREVFEEMPSGQQFSGYALRNLCVEKRPEFRWRYIDTFLHMMRKYLRGQYICIDRNKSIYKKL